MKNYIEYLKNNPKKLFLPCLMFIFGSYANIAVRWDGDLLRIGVLTFSAFVFAILNLQVWGEYKEIEGFLPTLKAFLNRVFSKHIEAFSQTLKSFFKQIKVSLLIFKTFFKWKR